MTSKPDTKTLRQQIRFVKATDGAQLAWAQSGRGPTLVKAANWLTHLEYELRSPVWKHWLEFFSKNFRFVRYDERGCGMSGWQDGELTLDQWAADLECSHRCRAAGRSGHPARHVAGCTDLRAVRATTSGACRWR